MSGFANPRKDHRFILEIDGFNQFLIEEVDPPEVEYEVHVHGAPGNIPNPNTPGKMKTNDMVVKKLMPAGRPDIEIWDWFGRAMLGDNLALNKQGFLIDLDPTSLVPVQWWYLGNIWPSKIKDQPRTSQGTGGNLIQEITFNVQFYFPRESAIVAGLLTGSAAGAAGAAFGAGTSN